MGKKVKVTRVVDVTEMGRLGGTATAKARTKAEREAAARVAVTARWAAYYKAHPEKLQEKKARAGKKGKKRAVKA